MHIYIYIYIDIPGCKISFILCMTQFYFCIRICLNFEKSPQNIKKKIKNEKQHQKNWLRTPIFFLKFPFFESWLTASIDSLPKQNNIENEHLDWGKIYINELQIFINDLREVRIYMETR